MSVVRGRMWKFGDNINTDLIFPQIAFTKPEVEQPKYCFSAIRPGWAEEARPGDIIVGGKNFGTGSGRPGGKILRALRLGGLVADSINGLFLRNCVNAGFPALICPGVSQAFSEGDEAQVDFLTGEVKNLTTGAAVRGQPLPEALWKIIEAGGIYPLLIQEGFVKDS